MKTLLLAVMLCGGCLAADKASDPAKAAIAAAREQQARAKLAMDFRRVADKLSADEVKAVQAIVTKHAPKPAVAAKPAAPAKHK